MAKVVLEIAADTTELGKATDAVSDFTRTTTKAGEAQKTAFKGGSDAAKEASKDITDLAKSVNIAGVNVGGIASKFTSFKSGVDVVTKSFGGLRTAIIATGIGALIVAVTSLIAFFKKTEKGAELLERALSGIGAAVDVIVGLAAKAGETLINAFKNPLAALKSFGDAILHPIDTIKSFGDAIAETATQISKAAEAAFELERAFQDLEDREREQSLILSKNQTEIDKLLIQAKNRTLSEKARLDLLQQASKLEEENLKIQVANAEEGLRIINAQNELKKANGTFRDEDDQRAIDAQLKIDELQRQSIVLQEKIINRRDAILDEAAQKQQKRLEDEQKAKDKLAKDEEDRINNLKKGYDEATKLNEQRFKQEENALKQARANALLTEDQYNEEVNQAKLKALDRQIDIIGDFNKQGLDLKTAATDAEIEQNNLVTESVLASNEKIAEERKKALDEEKKAFEDRLGIAQQFASDVGQLISESVADQEITLKAFAKNFLLLALDTLKKIVLLQEAEIVAKSLATPDSIASFGASGLVRSAIIVGLTEAAFGVAKAAISQNFYKGGYTGDGGKYDEAGTVHKGEFVSTKETTKQHRKLLEALHKNDYSKITNMDLAPILNGTGVGLREEVPIRINQRHDEIRSRNSDSSTILASMKKQQDAFFKFYKEKPELTEHKDGSKTLRIGNTIRRIKKS